MSRLNLRFHRHFGGYQRGKKGPWEEEVKRCRFDGKMILVK